MHLDRSGGGWEGWCFHDSESEIYFCFVCVFGDDGQRGEDRGQEEIFRDGGQWSVVFCAS